MNNKTILALIVTIAVGTVAVVALKTPSKNVVENKQSTERDVPSVTVPSNEGNNPFAATETPEPTHTAAPTSTPDVTPTPTPAPTQTSDFEDKISNDWIYGTKEQQVGSSVYFINSSDKRKIMKGTSPSDLSATAVFTSDTNGEVGSFVVNGGSMFVIIQRDSSTGYSKFKKVNLSTHSSARLYDLKSSKYSATQFAVRSDSKTREGFYIGLEGVNGAYSPAALYVENYVQQWIKPFEDTTKGSSITGMSPSKDLTSLLGLFDNSGSSEEGEIALVSPTP